LASRFKARDMREAVRDSIDRFQLFLARKVVCHWTSPAITDQRNVLEKTASVVVAPLEVGALGADANSPIFA